MTCTAKQFTAARWQQSAARGFPGFLSDIIKAGLLNRSMSEESKESESGFQYSTVMGCPIENE